MKRHPIITGTDSNHGMSAKIISIIQMLLAWALVIMVARLTLGSTQDTIKVILATRINTMTIAGTNTVASVGGVAVVVTTTAAVGTATVVGVEAVITRATAATTKTRTT